MNPSAVQTTRQPRRNGGGNIVLLVGLGMILFGSLRSPAFAKDAVVPVSDVLVLNWTGDPLLSVASIDSSFHSQLSRAVVQKYGTSTRAVQSGPGDAYYEYPNPIRFTGANDSVESHVRIRLELEQVTYTGVTNVADAITGLWALGIIGGLTSASPKVTAVVQYRATLFSESLADSIVILAYGSTAPDQETVSRQGALRIAHRRALWDLAYGIVDRLNAALDLKLERRAVRERIERYLERVDAS